MGLGQEQTTDRGIAQLVGRMADGFSKLVSQHLQLARAELAEDVRGMGLDVAQLAIFVPFVLVGYFFICGAVAALLAPPLGWAGALAAVGGVNLAGGGYGIFRAVNRLRTRDLMDGTALELNRSVSVLAAAPVPARNAIQEQAHGR
ncbi:phage holin family protein [Myxococcaceae bacterium GXIMD 01537]